MPYKILIPFQNIVMIITRNCIIFNPLIIGKVFIIDQKIYQNLEKKV